MPDVIMFYPRASEHRALDAGQECMQDRRFRRWVNTRWPGPRSGQRLHLPL